MYTVVVFFLICYLERVEHYYSVEASFVSFSSCWIADPVKILPRNTLISMNK